MAQPLRIEYDAQTKQFSAYLYGDIPLATAPQLLTLIRQLDAAILNNCPQATDVQGCVVSSGASPADAANSFGTPATPAEFDANNERIARAIAGGTD